MGEEITWVSATRLAMRSSSVITVEKADVIDDGLICRMLTLHQRGALPTCPIPRSTRRTIAQSKNAPMGWATVS